VSSHSGGSGSQRRTAESVTLSMQSLMTRFAKIDLEEGVLVEYLFFPFRLPLSLLLLFTSFLDLFCFEGGILF